MTFDVKSGKQQEENMIHGKVHVVNNGDIGELFEDDIVNFFS